MTATASGHQLAFWYKHFPPKSGLCFLPSANSPWVQGGGAASKGRSGAAPARPGSWHTSSPTAESLKTQRAWRALRSNNGDGEVVLILLLAVRLWPPGSAPELGSPRCPRGSQAPTALSDTSAL